MKSVYLRGYVPFVIYYDLDVNFINFINDARNMLHRIVALRYISLFITWNKYIVPQIWVEIFFVIFLLKV